MKIDQPKATRGFGYVGAWDDGCIGWFLPSHIGKWNSRQRPEPPNDHHCLAGGRTFLCEITIRPVKDKLGRPITRFAPEAKEKP